MNGQDLVGAKRDLIAMRAPPVAEIQRVQAKRGGRSRDFFGPSKACGLIFFELEEKVSFLSHNLLHALKLTAQRIGGDRGSRQIAPVQRNHQWGQ